MSNSVYNETHYAAAAYSQIVVSLSQTIASCLGIDDSSLPVTVQPSRCIFYCDECTSIRQVFLRLGLFTSFRLAWLATFIMHESFSAAGVLCSRFNILSCHDTRRNDELWTTNDGYYKVAFHGEKSSIGSAILLDESRLFDLQLTPFLLHFRSIRSALFFSYSSFFLNVNCNVFVFSRLLSVRFSITFRRESD